MMSSSEKDGGEGDGEGEGEGEGGEGRAAFQGFEATLFQSARVYLFLLLVNQ